MFGPVTLGAVTLFALVLQVFFVARVLKQERMISQRDRRIEKLRCELACADASLFRLNDKIAELQSDQPRRPQDAVVPLFPEQTITAPPR